MIPVIYEKGTQTFTTNGICRLPDCIMCEVTEERNGIYEVEFQYPVDGLHFDEIQIGRILYVTHDETKKPQPFDIYKRSAEIDGIVTFNASHISYRLGATILQPFTATTCAEALEKIPENALDGTKFTFWTDKVVTANFNLRIPQNIRATLSGVEGSILDVYGTGEYEFDKLVVKLYLNRGTDTPVQLRYGKNLVSITAEKDESGLYNAVIPYWYSVETGESVVLPAIVAEGTESKIEPWTNENGVAITDDGGNAFEFDALKLSTYTMDLTPDFPEKPTAAQLEATARKRFQNAQPWVADENITVDFVQMWSIEEYMRYAPLQRLKLCDTVLVLYPEAGVNVRKKIIKVVYNPLLERYSSMELGTPHATLSETIQNVTQQATMIAASSMMQQAVGKATEMITGGLGGYVVINMINDRPAEILILDAPTIEEAVNVIRMNENGIGFSHDGYNGTYSTAWTIDGAFNADFITTGSLSANRIYGGIIRAINGDSTWNLDTGAYMNGGEVTRTYITGGQIYTAYKVNDEWVLYGSIRSLTNKGIALKAPPSGMASLAVTDSNGNSDSVFIANDISYGGFSEPAIIDESARFIEGVHFNKNVYFDYEYTGYGRVNVCQIAKMDSGYFGTGHGMGMAVYGAFFQLMAQNSSGQAQRLISINTNNTTSNFGRMHFHAAVEFGDALFSISSKASGYDYSSLRITARQLIVDDTNTTSIVGGNYGTRFVKAVYCDDAVNCLSLTQRSDERLKDFQEWDERYDGILDNVEPQLYTWKENPDKRVHVGLSAQKLKKAIEDEGITDSGIVTEDEYLSISYTEIPLLMLRKIKKQQETIETLEAKVETLERKLDALCKYMNYQPGI